jgi:integrating conjugative element protein (TIGR03757 family)
MIARRRFLALGSLAALPCFGALARADSLNPYAGISTVEVFCNSAMLIKPIENPPFRQSIYRMDALQQELNNINQHIAHSSMDAARQWASDNQQQIKRLVTAPALASLNAINLARYYKIDRLPAIVINRRSVVYGVTDVADAISRYQAHVQGRG